jgi:uncharacterized protein
MTPLLVLMFGVAPTVSVGTDLWFAATTKTTGGCVHQRAKSIDWEVVRRLATGSLPAAGLTLLALHALGGSPLKGGLIIHALGVVLILTAIAMLLRTKMHDLGKRLRHKDFERFRAAQPTLTVCAGVLLGILVTLTSVGAGALGSVMLLYIYPVRMTPQRLVGTDTVHAIPLTVLAGLGHLWLGNVSFPLLGHLLLGSIPGVLIGSWASSKMPAVALSSALSAVLGLVAMKMLLA